MGCHHQGKPAGARARRRGRAEGRGPAQLDRGARGRQRFDVTERVEAWAERSLYLPTGGQRPQDNDRPALLTPSTYRLGGIAYVALGEPGARTGD